ncbi:MAG TPA: hypothetical protein ENH40_02450 [Nitrospirae bacterium]|nr:hypothetical protein [Nitrospirota bacterium]
MAGSKLDLSTKLTLGELTKRTANGNLMTIANVLESMISVIEDGHWVKCNKDTYHLYSQWLEEPTGEWSAINTGVGTYAGRSKPGEQGVGMLEAYSFVDDRLISKVRDRARARMQEDMAFIRGLTKTFGTGLLYGNSAIDIRVFDGWATRYWDPTNQDNVWDVGGSGSDNTSIYIVQWGPELCYFIFPEGSETSLKHEDLEKKLVYDGNNNPFQCWVSHFIIEAGFVVNDPRAFQRIGSIESVGAANIFDPDLLIQALDEMPYEGIGAAIYLNKKVLTQMKIASKDKTNVNYTWEDAFGKRKLLHFEEIPVKRFDQILITEDAI